VEPRPVGTPITKPRRTGTPLTFREPPTARAGVNAAAAEISAPHLLGRADRTDQISTRSTTEPLPPKTLFLLIVSSLLLGLVTMVSLVFAPPSTRKAILGMGAILEIGIVSLVLMTKSRRPKLAFRIVVAMCCLAGFLVAYAYVGFRPPPEDHGDSSRSSAPSIMAGARRADDVFVSFPPRPVDPDQQRRLDSMKPTGTTGACDASTGTCASTNGSSRIDPGTPSSCPGGGNCSSHGSCDASTGTCTCSVGYSVPACDSCASGFAGYPTCERCDRVMGDSPSCWTTIYRFQDTAKSPAPRCWNTRTTAPTGCSGYTYEAEAFVVPSTAVPGTFHARQCSKLTDHIIVEYQSSDYTSLVGAGYDCSVDLGHPYRLGMAPSGNTLFARQCSLWRFRYSTSGGGAHIFTKHDSTTGLTCEGPARATVLTNFTCFQGTPSGC